MLSHRMIIISQLCSPARALSLYCLDLNTTGSPDVPRCVFIWYFSQLWIIRVSYSPWMRRGRWISYHQSALHEMTVQVAFPHSLAGKASACNAEGPSLIPGLGRSLGEGKAAYSSILGLPVWLNWERICLQCMRPGFHPCVGKIPWRRERLSTPVFWPGEFHWLYSPWGCKELDVTEQLSLSLAQERDCQPPWQTASYCAVWQSGGTPRASAELSWMDETERMPGLTPPASTLTPCPLQQWPRHQPRWMNSDLLQTKAF